VVPDSLSVRERLLAEAAKFVRNVRRLPGVRRIALLGSVVTEKSEPKDVDLLVWIDETADLGAVATFARRLQGRLQSWGRGADVFLADERGKYLGRTCPWKDCGPGLRVACDAQHCGRRPHLHDDLRAIYLAPEMISAPPLELWPQIARRCQLPVDVEDMLAQLQDAA
jgi:predicted nucleotidyltransferase